MSNKSNKLKFIGLSLLGAIFFLVPLTINGESQILLSHITTLITENWVDPFILFTQFCMGIVLIGTIIFLFYESEYEPLNDVFKTTPVNVGLRLSGAFIYLMVLNNWFSGTAIGDLILHEDTGGVMAGEDGLLTILYITFFIAILTLPLLTHFGMVEFIGTLSGDVMKKLFKIPGSSVVNALASFVGDGTIGIVVTDNQYKRGYYTKREAYIIASSFSIVGIAFAAAVANELQLGHIFPIYYMSILLTTLMIAFVIARLPLKKYPDEYYKGKEPKKERRAQDGSTFQQAYESAVEQAADVEVWDAFKEACVDVINIYVGFLPIIMVVGTISLVIAENTPVFDVISYPFIYIYQFLGFGAEAAQAMAPASLAGFADMYLPALFVTGVESEAARFFISVLAFTQLVFMSETGMIFIKTEIGYNFLDIVKLFLFRTVLSLPIIYGITRLLAALNIISF